MLPADIVQRRRLRPDQTSRLRSAATRCRVIAGRRPDVLRWWTGGKRRRLVTDNPACRTCNVMRLRLLLLVMRDEMLLMCCWLTTSSRRYLSPEISHLTLVVISEVYNWRWSTITQATSMWRTWKARSSCAYKARYRSGSCEWRRRSVDLCSTINMYLQFLLQWFSSRHSTLSLETSGDNFRVLVLSYILHVGWVPGVGLWSFRTVTWTLARQD